MATLRRRGAFAVLAIALAGCSQPAPVPAPPPHEAAVTRKPVQEAAPATATAATSPAPTVVVPPGSQYVCVVGTGTARTETAIVFAPKVAQLCARHPEMGPCQYERELCRRGGGRVYAADGVEITPATEAEYDRKVLRVRFKAN